MSADEPQFNSLRSFTVTNGTLGPVLWCPQCDEQMGYLTDRVSLAVLQSDARRHLEAEHR